VPLFGTDQTIENEYKLLIYLKLLSLFFYLAGILFIFFWTSLWLHYSMGSLGISFKWEPISHITVKRLVEFTRTNKITPLHFLGLISSERNNHLFLFYWSRNYRKCDDLSCNGNTLIQETLPSFFTSYDNSKCRTSIVFPELNI
jgi:hypothetical protein